MTPTPLDFEEQYLDLLTQIKVDGITSPDRTGVGTLSVFHTCIGHHFSMGFPLLRTKRVWFHGVKAELLWFLSGDTNVLWLQDQGVHIWDAWADQNGDLGRVYGAQWRDWNSHGLDQLQQLVHSLKHDPFSRRHLVTAWNPDELHKMALPPCHYSFQCHVDPPEVPGGKLRLSLLWNQRSVDVFLGLPFNIASYALLCCMLAQVCDMDPHYVGFSGGNTHIYKNHLDQVELQLSNKHFLDAEYPTLALNPTIKNLFDFFMDDICVEEYVHAPTIKAPIAV